MDTFGHQISETHSTMNSIQKKISNHCILRFERRSFEWWGLQVFKINFFMQKLQIKKKNTVFSKINFFESNLFLVFNFSMYLIPMNIASMDPKLKIIGPRILKKKFFPFKMAL